MTTLKSCARLLFEFVDLYKSLDLNQQAPYFTYYRGQVYGVCLSAQQFNRARGGRKWRGRYAFMTIETAYRQAFQVFVALQVDATENGPLLSTSPRYAAMPTIQEMHACLNRLGAILESLDGFLS